MWLLKVFDVHLLSVSYAPSKSEMILDAKAVLTSGCEVRQFVFELLELFLLKQLQLLGMLLVLGFATQALVCPQ